jgi:AcrR family transcriptional regulator
MDEIAAATKLTKRTLYYHFESKDQLLAAVLEAQHHLALAAFRTFGDRLSGSPEAIIDGLFHELAVWSDKPRWAGSGFTRLVIELADLPGHPARVFTGVTTGARGLEPHDYASWIDRQAYLRPDVICLVPDPAGHVLGDSAFLPDRRSVAFAVFGYSPILPLVLQEKGLFAHSPLLRLAGNTLAAADAVVGRRMDRTGAAIAGGADYEASIAAAVRAGQRSSTAGIVVVLSPADDSGRVKERLASTFANDRVRVVDLGGDPRMRDPGLRLDGFSFSAGGHAAAAEIIAPAVFALLGDAERRAP